MRNLRGPWVWSAACALLCTVIGAGFASGQEVMRFFTRYGAASWWGIGLSCAAFAALLHGTMRLALRHGADELSVLLVSMWGRRGVYASILYGALFLLTAGAMMAAFGELVQLVLPWRHAYTLGVAVAIALGGLSMRYGMRLLSLLGTWMLPVCIALYALLFATRQAMPAVQAVVEPMWHAFALAPTYAAMNVAVSAGIACELARTLSQRAIRGVSAATALLLLLLLLCANAVLLPMADTLQNTALPMIQAARGLGAPGFWLSALVLALAILTTLLANLRSLLRIVRHVAPPRVAGACVLAGSLLVALTGFTSIVGVGYPLLGGCCAVLLLLMQSTFLRKNKPGSHKADG